MRVILTLYKKGNNARAGKQQMAKKTQSTQMKNAYGQRFSQNDLTTKEEHQLPQPLETSTSEKGDVSFLARLMRGRTISFVGRKKDN